MSVDNFLFDFGIIGAGIAGLTCAKRLQSQGKSVLVMDKSRGVGGRIATRRIDSLKIDHGLPYITPDGQYTRDLISLCSPWTITPPTYVHREGMNTIAKHLSEGVNIRRYFLVTSIAYTGVWKIKSQDGEEVEAKSLIVAIPAPQALSLLENSSLTDLPFCSALACLRYAPCITVMAGYDRVLGDNLPKFTEAITPDIRWLGLDSSKREQSPQSVVVLHSSPDYAVANFESPLEYLAPVLLTKGGVSNPDWLQVHRWRYAFPLIRLRTDYLISEDIPIFGCGDWCCDYLPPLEGAMTSAVALAKSLIKGE